MANRREVSSICYSSFLSSFVSAFRRQFFLYLNKGGEAKGTKLGVFFSKGTKSYIRMNSSYISSYCDQKKLSRTGLYFC